MIAKTTIAHIAPQLETGGMERLLVEFARHADRRRFELTFVSLGAKSGVAGELEACGWPVESLGVDPGVRPTAVFALCQLLRRRGIDLVHTHNTRALLYAGPAARLAGARVVHTRHGRRHRETRRQSTLVRLAGACAHQIVCVSEDVRRLARAQRGYAARTVTIHNGIDTERFRCTGPTPGGAAVFVGRLSPEKDVRALLDAVALIVPRCPQFRLQIAGAGPCDENLARHTDDLGIGANVQFLGEVSDVTTLLPRASMLVLSSITEGLPLSVLEAMSTGLPVVATHVGGVAEAVEDGHTGLLVPPRRPDLLADAIMQLVADPELGRAMGAAARQRAVERFDVRTMVARYESLYGDVLASTPNTGKVRKRSAG